MNPGDQINIYYNPKNPREISTLVLLGASTGSIIMAVALAFLVFYFWFFWLRGFLRRSGPDDFGDGVVGLSEINTPASENQWKNLSTGERRASFGKR